MLEVAERLHYIPNSSGQNLRSQERRAIGLFVYELTGAYYAVLDSAGIPVILLNINRCAKNVSSVVFDPSMRARWRRIT